MKASNFTFVFVGMAQAVKAFDLNKFRLLTNAEGDNKPIVLNEKQWGVLVGGSIVFFVAFYFVLGLCFKSTSEEASDTRETSSTLTQNLLDSPVEEKANNSGPQDVVVDGKNRSSGL